MGYYESVLRDLPRTAFKLNSAETAYIDYTGRNQSITGAPVFSPSILAGSPKSLLLSGGSSLNFPGTVFAQTDAEKPFSLEAWAAPLTNTGTIGIISHSTTYDGLTFDGNNINFTVKTYLGTSVTASWPVPDFMEAYHLVGVYNTQKVQLYVNGEMVSETAVPPEMFVGGFWASGIASLYVGYSPVTTQRIVVDGIVTYAHALSPSSIRQHFIDGRDVLTMSAAVAGRGGAFWNGSGRKAVMSKTYSSATWTDSAMYSNVSMSSGDLVPLVNQTNLQSKAGEWKTAVPLDAIGDTSLGGIQIEWDGDGLFTVETSLDNITYTAVQNGRLATGSLGLNTTTTNVLFIRVRFTGGVVDDISEIRRLSYSVYTDMIVDSDDLSRVMEIDGNVTTAAEPNEPIERNLHSGFDFYGGQLWIYSDVTETPKNIQSTEMWLLVRGLSGVEANLIAYSIGGNYLRINTTTRVLSWVGASAVYLNGVAITSGATAINLNEWNHILYVASSTTNTSIIIGDTELNGQMGMVALHQTAPSAATALEMYRSYSKMPLATAADASTITIAEVATPFNLYNYAWDISAGG